MTDVHSPNNVSVEGMPWHVLDLRREVGSLADEEKPQKLAKI